MLSIKPKKINALILSKNPVQLIGLSDDEKEFEIKFNFYLDPMVVIKNDIVDMEIILAPSPHDRPSVFNGVKNLSNDLNRSVSKRVNNIKNHENRYFKNSVFGTSITNLLSAIPNEVQVAIQQYFDGVGTLEKINELMPHAPYIEEKKIDDVKSNETIITQYPYNIQNHAIEFLNSKEIKKRRWRQSEIKPLISNISNLGLSLSELGNFVFPIIDDIKKYVDISNTRIGNIYSSKFSDSDNISSIQSDLGDNLPINDLYTYFVELKSSGEFEKIMVSKNRAWAKFPISVKMTSRKNKKIDSTIEAIFNIRSSTTGIQERHVVPINLVDLIDDLNQVRISPHISVNKINNSAEVFLKQRDRRAKGIKVLRRTNNGNYKNVGTVALLHNEETTIVDATFSDLNECKNVIYRAIAIDNGGKMTSVFNDSSLICGTSDNSGGLNPPANNAQEQTSCYLSEIGSSGNSGKSLVHGIVNITSPLNSLYSVYRIFLTQNGSPLGDNRTLINVNNVGSLLTSDTTSSTTFQFNDELDPGVWRYEIEAMNENFHDVIHKCEIIISEFVNYDNNNVTIQGDTDQLLLTGVETTYEKIESNFVVKTLITQLNDVDSTVDINSIRVEFKLNNTELSFVGINSIDDIGNNHWRITSIISLSNIKSSIEDSIGSIITNQNLRNFIVQSNKSHIIPLGVN